MTSRAIPNAQELPVQAVTDRDQRSRFWPNADWGTRGGRCINPRSKHPFARLKDFGCQFGYHGAAMIGQQFGNYRVLSLLGEGGMGAVYLAEHPGIGRRVA